MTPARAREIWGATLRATPPLADISAAGVNAILAACREERHAALTEAAEVCIRDSSEEYFAERILALRDRDQPKE